MMANIQSCGNRSPISGECILGCGGFGGCQRGYEDHIKPRSDLFNPLTGRPFPYVAVGDLVGMMRDDIASIDLKAAQFEDLTRKIMEKMQEAIEARLKRLVADGIAIDRIRLEQHPDGSTAIIVDNIPDSSFRISYDDLRGE